MMSEKKKSNSEFDIHHSELRPRVPVIRFKGFSGEWEENQLGDIYEFKYGQYNNNPSDGGPYPVYGANGIIGGYSHFNAEDSIVIGHMGEYAGSVLWGKGKHFVTYNGTISKPKKSNIAPIFGYYIFYRKNIKKICGGSGQPFLSYETLQKLTAAFPVQSAEQTKIGNYFQQLDTLITQHQKKHDKLLTLKKSLLEKMFPKQGQAEPEMRFKGFSGEWEVEKLGDIGETYTGLSGKTKEDFGHGEGRFVTYMNVFSNAVTNTKLMEAVEIDNSQNQVKLGDVFFTTSSETPEEVGMSSVWMNNTENVYLNSFCFGYRPKHKFNNYFLAYILRSSFFRNQITLLAQGISRYNISKNKAMELSVNIPEYEEQSQVGVLFNKLDRLITHHQTQLKKLNNIKQACLAKMFV